MKYCIAFSLWVLASISPPAYSADSALSELTPEKKVASYIKETLDHLTEQEIYTQMEGHFKTIRLMDAAGRWIDPSLEGVATKLFPKITV